MRGSIESHEYVGRVEENYILKGVNEIKLNGISERGNREERERKSKVTDKNSEEFLFLSVAEFFFFSFILFFFYVCFSSVGRWFIAHLHHVHVLPPLEQWNRKKKFFCDQDWNGGGK